MTVVLSCSADGSVFDAWGESAPDRWREDLDALDDAVRTVHIDPFHGVSEPDFAADVAELRMRIPELTHADVIVNMMELVSSISGAGRDGHTQMFPVQDATGFRILPLWTYRFDDGFFVIDADGGHRDLVGRKITSIGRADLEAVFDALVPVVPRDNQMDFEKQLPLYAMVPEILRSVGMSESAESVRIGFADGTNVTVEPISWNTFKSRFPDFFGRRLPRDNEVLFLSRPDDAFWFTELAGGRVVYFRYNRIHERSGSTHIDQFTERLRSVLENPAVEKLVIDLRLDRGGNSATYRSLIEMLRRSRVNRPGQLYLLTDRGTFSAASNFVTDMEAATSAIIVGEAPGGAPAGFGDPVKVKLPQSRIEIWLSTRFHPSSLPNDDRLAHDPAIPVPYMSSHYFTGADPVLDAALND